MNVNFKYVDYDENFWDFYQNNKFFQGEDVLYIFSDYRMRDIFNRKIGHILNGKPTFKEWNEFKENIFTTDYTVLRESKRVIVFYKSLPKKIRKELKIKSYFDIIDMAQHFFRYYKNLNLSLCPHMKNICKWQETPISTYREIKKSFDNLCEKSKYIPSDWIEDYKNYNGEELQKYNKIVFVDVVEFPPLYQKIIKELSENCEIIINLQMEASSFDETNFKIREVLAPTTNAIKKVIVCENSLQEAYDIISKDYQIFSPKDDNKFYEMFPNYYARQQKFTLDDTKIYKFLETQHTLLSNRIRTKYHIKDMVEAFDNRSFRDYYDIDKEDYKEILTLLKESYKYIGKNTQATSEFKYKIKNIIDDLNCITKIKNVMDLYNYITKTLDISRLFESDYDNIDIMEKILEILGLMQVSEDIDFYDVIDGGNSFFRLFIQSMKGINIKSNIIVGKNISTIKSLDFAMYDKNIKGINCFVDITDDNLPKIKQDSSLFTERQKKELGILTIEDYKQIEKYRFYQALLTKDCVVYTINNIDDKIVPSPFLIEIVEKNNLTMEYMTISSNDIYQNLQDSFMGVDISNEKTSDELLKEKDDFVDERVKFGAYDINNIKSCQRKYYFNKIGELENIKKYEIEHFDKRLLGIVVHNALEEIVKNSWKNIINSQEINIPQDVIKIELEKIFKKENIKFEKFMEKYITNIIIPHLCDNIMEMFSRLNNEYKNTKITRFQGERYTQETDPFYSGNIDVYLNGRADLIIETTEFKEIIDYKTGSTNATQLDFYNIMLYPDEICKLATYNLWENEYKVQDKIKMSSDDLLEIVKNFSDNKIYVPMEKIKKCKDENCEYIMICRRGKV